jgi:hypothetical protein
MIDSIEYIYQKLQLDNIFEVNEIFEDVFEDDNSKQT